MVSSSVDAQPRGTPSSARLDLRDEVTVFVMTVGAPTYRQCLEHLQLQDCRFRLEIIDHVAPISAASQCMIDRCVTPFFVQVDEDMLLYPHAILTLHELIRDASPKVAEVVGMLFDVHLERAIEGVKIFRHEILRHYPFENEDGCDIRQVRRMEADGFQVVRHRGDGPEHLDATSPEIMGLHGTCYTPRSIYERYLTFWLKARRGTIRTRAPSHDAHRFLERFLEEPSELNFYALLGILSAQLIETEAQLGEKDYRTYDELPGYRGLAAYWRDCQRGWPREEPASS